MHPRRAPTRVRLRHPPNQRADIGGHRRAPEAAPTLPGPPQPKAPSVPGDDGLRLDDHERRWPSGPKAREHDPEPAVRLRERHPPRSGALEHRQLVPQGKYFKLKRGARMRQRSEGEEEREQYRHDRPGSVSIVGRNINCRNKNGLFSRHKVMLERPLLPQALSAHDDLLSVSLVL